MYPYYEQFRALIERLAVNPRLQLLRQQFVFPNRSLADMTRMAHSIERAYGFILPEDDWQLYHMPGITDIAWITRPEVPLLQDNESPSGCLTMLNLGVSLDEVEFHLYDTNPDYEPFAGCSYLETGGAESWDYRTFLRYDQAQRQLLGVALFDRPDVLPMTTSLGEYMRAALAWHGAYGWQFLYLPLLVFQQLPPVTRQKVYDLPRILPELFPDADWSIIATKREYFDTEHTLNS